MGCSRRALPPVQDMDLDELIAAMKRYGYDGLEARVEWDHASGIEASLTADERAAVRAKLEANGLELCCVATGVRMADPDRAAREKHIEDLHTYIDLAADLGATRVRTFGGPQAGRKGELHAAVEYAVEGYAQCVDHAAERGVTILMETHDDWSNSASVRAVVERLNHPNLKVLWDCMHPQRMLESVEESFAAVGQHTEHVHAHDGVYDPETGGLASPPPPLGKGVFDHQTPWKLLDEIGCACPHNPRKILRSGELH